MGNLLIHIFMSAISKTFPNLEKYGKSHACTYFPNHEGIDKGRRWVANSLKLQAIGNPSPPFGGYLGTDVTKPTIFLNKYLGFMNFHKLLKQRGRSGFNIQKIPPEVYIQSRVGGGGSHPGPRIATKIIGEHLSLPEERAK